MFNSVTRDTLTGCLYFVRLHRRPQRVDATRTRSADIGNLQVVSARWLRHSAAVGACGTATVHIRQTAGEPWAARPVPVVRTPTPRTQSSFVRSARRTAERAARSARRRGGGLTPTAGVGRVSL